MAVHITDKNTNKVIIIEPNKYAEEENSPEREAAISELKEIFDGYNKEINECEYLEEHKEEEIDEEERRKTEALNKCVNEMYKLHKFCLKILDTFIFLENELRKG